MIEATLFSPKRELFKGRANRITVSDTNGEMQILQNHAPLLSVLAKGDIVIEGDSGISQFKILSGFIEVHDNKAIILAREEHENRLEKSRETER